MNQITHKHNWRVLVGAQHNNNSGDNDPAVFKCDGCGLVLHASDAVQLELWKHTIGWQKWLTIVAIVISIGSLIISAIALFR